MQDAFTETPRRNIIRADGVTKEIRVQDGHLFVCQGCCCGRTDKGFPPLPIDDFRKQWKARGIRRRFHLTISGCLGPCPLANVVLLLFRGRSLWLHSINNTEDVASIYSYVEAMLQANKYLDPPLELRGRMFERYLDGRGVSMQSAGIVSSGVVAVDNVAARWPAVGLMLLGITIVYLVGFLSVPEVHNATHDTRHATGFPCH